jgi:hypothetical protein
MATFIGILKILIHVAGNLSKTVFVWVLTVRAFIIMNDFTLPVV